MVHFTDEVGSVPQNASPYGALDMAGNVWEWVDDWYAGYPGGHSRSDAYGQKYKVIRGGSWVSSALSLTTVARDFADPNDNYDSIGFRCVRDAK
jgi:formylglycine-generating enzyme required for sulfatase activity